MMFTGTPQELADLTRKARTLLEEIAERMNQLDEIAPGGTWGDVGSLGGTVVRRRGGWEVDENR